VKIELDLTTVPPNCWWWTGIGIYLVVSWLLVGPWLSRSNWRRQVKKWPTMLDLRDREVPWIIWLFSPLYWPLVVLWIGLYRLSSKPLGWLIYGSSK